MAEHPAIAVVIVTHDSAADIAAALTALAPQLDPRDEVVVVDNDSRDGTPQAARRALVAARVIETGANVGFAAACNLGAEATRAPLLLFLNPDTVAHPGCIAALRAAAADHPRWGAWQALVVLPGGATVNTSGGRVHFLGMGWAGEWGRPVGAVGTHPREVAFASGAALTVRRDAWQTVGAFDPAYFMYCEDLDLSLRLWLADYRVGLVPSAVVTHDYEFDRGARKWELLETNRWRTVLAVYPLPLLILLSPALVAFEGALLLLAARRGWMVAKLRAQAAVMRALPSILRRRREVQARRTVGARAFAQQLTAEVDTPYLGSAAGSGRLLRLQQLYWQLVLGMLGRCPSGR